MCSHTWTALLYIFCTGTPALHTLSLHDALPICQARRDHRGSRRSRAVVRARPRGGSRVAELSRLPKVDLHIGQPRRLSRHSRTRSEEHTSELQSRENLVCRLLLEKKKKEYTTHI